MTWKFQSPVSGRGRQVRQGFRTCQTILGLKLASGLTTAVLLLPLPFSATPTDAEFQPKNARYWAFTVQVTRRVLSIILATVASPQKTDVMILYGRVVLTMHAQPAT